jgi:glycosyltransferase involved in cell wall biosynthesis
MYKVIYILSHTPNYDYLYQKPPISYETKQGSWIGIFYNDWGNLIGNVILEYSDNSEFEFWRPDYRADQIYNHKFDNNLVHRVFPAYNVNGEVYSEEMMYKLDNIIRNEKNIILDIGINKNLINESIIDFFGKRAPIICRSLGNLSFIKTKHSLNIFKYPSKILKKQKFLKYIKQKQKYISIPEFLPLEKKFKSIIIHDNIYLFHHTIGIDDQYFNNHYNKTQYKKKLNLPPNKKVFFSSSRLHPLKQVDKLIEVFSQLNADNFTLVISGKGSNTYKDILQGIINSQKKDIRLIGFLEESELIDYYKAADYFIDASRNDGGPKSAWKAMGLGVPVITTATGNAGVFLRKHNAGCFIPKKKYNKWKKTFKRIIEGKISIQPVEVEKVRSVISWPVCAQKFINSYNFVLKDFYGE